MTTIEPGQVWRWTNEITKADGSRYVEPVSEPRRRFNVAIDDSGGDRIVKRGDTFLVIANDEGPYVLAPHQDVKHRTWYIVLLNECLVWMTQYDIEQRSELIE